MASQWLRCPATDPEGYRCVRILSHEGSHERQRCPWTDPDGYPCFLPPSHPGDHELAWFAKPTTPGATRTVRHQGDYEWAATQAQEEAHELAFHNWFPASQTYVPGTSGKGARVRAFLNAAKPAGELVVVYEYRPETSAPAITAVPVPIEPDAARATDDTKTCPQCAEQVKAAALVCRFCRYEFGPPPPPCQPGVGV